MDKELGQSIIRKGSLISPPFQGGHSRQFSQMGNQAKNDIESNNNPIPEHRILGIQKY